MNLKLRSKLKELNVQLSRSLDKVQKGSLSPARRGAGPNHGQPDVGHQIRSKEHELSNVQRQVDTLGRECEAMQKKIGEMSGADRLLLMEQELKQQVSEREELTRKIKNLAKIEKTHANALGRHSKQE